MRRRRSLSTRYRSLSSVLHHIPNRFLKSEPSVEIEVAPKSPVESPKRVSRKKTPKNKAVDEGAEKKSPRQKKKASPVKKSQQDDAMGMILLLPFIN
jgi:hypothetical protein